MLAGVNRQQGINPKTTEPVQLPSGPGESELEKNLRLAEEMVKHVRYFATVGSNTEEDFREKELDGIHCGRLRQKIINEAVEIGKDISNDLGIDTLEFDWTSKIFRSLYLKYGYGHSGEMASTAFVEFQEKGIPVDYCMTSVGNSELVVIGRKENSDINDKSTWGDAAVASDAWARKWYPVSRFHEMQRPEHDVKLPLCSYGDGEDPEHYLVTPEIP